MLLRFSCIIAVIITICFALVLLYKSKLFAKVRMEGVHASKLMGLKIYLLMKKYKIFYRVLLELVVIWFIFEWNNGLIAETVSRWLFSLYVWIEPILLRIVAAITFITPYGRTTVLENETIQIWMLRFSIGIAIMLVINIIFIFADVDKRGRKIFANLIAILIDWYAMFGVAALVMKAMPQEHIILCWIVAAICYVVVQVTIDGILFGAVLDRL